MNNQHDLSLKQQQGLLIKMVGKIIIRIMIIGLALAFGFWLIIASNMGPAYLSNVCGGCLDMGIRLTLLGIGILIWVVIAVWLAWLIGRYIYRFIRRIK